MAIDVNELMISALREGYETQVRENQRLQRVGAELERANAEKTRERTVAETAVANARTTLAALRAEIEAKTGERDTLTRERATLDAQCGKIWVGLNGLARRLAEALAPEIADLERVARAEIDTLLSDRPQSR